MAIEYTGSLYCGPVPDDTRYYAWTGPTTPASNGAWTYLWIGVRFHHLVPDPLSNPSSAASFLWRAWKTSWGGGTGGNDCWLRFIAENNSNAANVLKVQAQFRKSAWLNTESAALSSAANAIERNKVYTFALVVDPTGGTVKLYKCEQGESAVQLGSTGTYNTSWSSRALGTCDVGVGSAMHYLQAVAYVKDVALTTTEIESIAAGTDLESVVASANRGQLHLFASPAATITPTWGTGDATRNGTWTTQPTCSPVLANAATRIECAEPVPLSFFSPERGTSAADIPLSGTYTGFTPATFQYRLLNAFTQTEAVAWTNLSSFSAAAGSWSGTISAAATGTYLIQLRDSTATSTTWRGGNPICVGPAVLTIGQSPMNIFEGATSVAANGDDFFVTLAVGDFEPFMAAPTLTGRGAQAAADWFQTQGGGPLLMVGAAITGTSSGQWAAAGSTQWASALTKLDTAGPPKGHLHVMWLNGAADVGDVASIGTNQDTIYGKIGSDIGTTRGLSYSYVMLPHQRDTQNSDSANFSVRDAQRTWAIDHADFGAGVYLGPWLGDLRMNCEQVGTARGGTSNTIQFAADYEGSSSEPPTNIWLIDGPGSGQSATVASYNASTLTATISGTWTTTPDNTTTYAAWGSSPHESTTGADSATTRMGYRIGQHVAAAHGYSDLSDQGPSITSCTYPHGGDGSIIDVHVTHVDGSNLRTVDDGTGSTSVYGFEVSDDAGSTFAVTIVSAEITGPSTVRLTLASAPANPADLRVRYLYGEPVPAADFRRLGDLLYDDSDIGDTEGLPVWYTPTDLSVTEAAASGNLLLRLMTEGLFVGGAA